MYCKECGNIIADNAKICPRCGCPTETKDISTNKELLPQQTYSQQFDTSILIIIWAIIVIICGLSQNLITRFVSDWYYGATKYVYFAISIIQNLSLILPVLTIKKKGVKVAFVILVSALIIFYVVSIIMAMI